MKCGSLKLLEPSGPVQACNGIALTVPLLSQGLLYLYLYLYFLYEVPVDTDVC